MLYVAIDQHAKQITVVIRNDQGEDVLKRQVSTRREKIKVFFDQLIAMDAEFMAILESCGFNDWLLEELRRRKCREIVLIHPEKPSKKKTDRRDARKLCDLLWLNRERLAASKPVHGLRRIYIATKREKDDRQITSLRQGLGRRRTRVLNKIQRILHRYNLMWDYPYDRSSTRSLSKSRFRFGHSNSTSRRSVRRVPRADFVAAHILAARATERSGQRFTLRLALLPAGQNAKAISSPDESRRPRTLEEHSASGAADGGSSF